LKVLIFIPTAGYRPYPQMESAYTNAKNYLLSQTSEHEIREYRCQVFPIDANRNCCVGHAIEGMQGFMPDTTIWIDADTVIPFDALWRLLKPKHRVVAGLYRAKREPHHYHSFDRWKKDEELGRWVYRPAWIPREGLFTADCVGMGCNRVDVEVLKTMTAPYFKYPLPSRLERKGVVEGLEFMIRHFVYINTEEAYFWQNVVDNGFKIWVDSELRCKHMTEVAIDDDYYDMWSKANPGKIPKYED
jgi:hypothetical protein